MNKYILEENNSGGYTMYLDCLIENSGRPQYVLIEANSYKEAIEKLNNHIEGFDYMELNSYEGSSCNCCGRRFTLRTDNKNEEDWGIVNIMSIHGDIDELNKLVKLEDAPTKLKKA